MTLAPSFLGFSMFPAHLMQLLPAFCFQCSGSSCKLATEDPFCCYCNMRRSLQVAARMQFTWNTDVLTPLDPITIGANLGGRNTFIWFLKSMQMKTFHQEMCFLVKLL